MPECSARLSQYGNQKDVKSKRWFLLLNENLPIAKGYVSSPFVIPWAKLPLTEVTKQLQKGGESWQFRGSSPLISGQMAPVYSMYHVAIHMELNSSQQYVSAYFVTPFVFPEHTYL